MAGGRDALGRFAKGNAGKPRGARHAMTLAIEAHFDEFAELITASAIAAAVRGDVVAIRLVLDRIAPRRRGAPVALPGFPKIETAADVPVALAFLAEAAAAGSVTVDEAKAFGELLAAFAAAIDTAALAARLDALEKRLDGDGT